MRNADKRSRFPKGKSEIPAGKLLFPTGKWLFPRTPRRSIPSAPRDRERSRRSYRRMEALRGRGIGLTILNQQLLFFIFHYFLGGSGFRLPWRICNTDTRSSFIVNNLLAHVVKELIDWAGASGCYILVALLD